MTQKTKVFPCTIERVIDGDTIDVLASLGFHQYTKVRVRLDGIDCPETRTKDQAEKQRGLAAKARVAELLAQESTQDPPKHLLESHALDKYGRVLGDIILTDSGRGLVGILIHEGHGRPYYGGKRKKG